MPDAEPVVVHESEVALDRDEDGNLGAVTWRTLISGDRTPTSGLTVGVADVPPGQPAQAGLHRHEPAEIYYVLEGEGTMVIDEAEHPLRVGSAVFVPPNAWHVARNTGEGTLRILYAFPTDSFTDVTYEWR